MKINKTNIEEVIKRFKKDNNIKRVQDIYGDNIQEAIDNLGDQDAFCIINKAILFFGNNKTIASDKAAKQIMNDVNDLVNIMFNEPYGTINVPIVDSAIISDAIEWRLDTQVFNLNIDTLHLIVNEVISNKEYQRIKEANKGKIRKLIILHAFLPDEYNNFMANKEYIENAILDNTDNDYLTCIVKVAFNIIDKLKKDNKITKITRGE